MSEEEDPGAQAAAQAAAQEEADRIARAERDAKQAAEEAERREAERREEERQRVAVEALRIEEVKRAAMEVANQQREQAITAGAEVVDECGVQCPSGDGYCGAGKRTHPMPHQCPNNHTWGPGW